MKEHKTPYPILIHILEGSIALGVQGEIYAMENADIIALDGNIPHDLTAIEDTITPYFIKTRHSRKTKKCY